MSPKAKRTIGVALLFSLVGTVAYVNRLELALMGVHFAMKQALPTGPNREVVW